MTSVVTELALEQLQPGDRLTYHGVQWQVIDYSTYDDANGYQTAEWLLRSPAGKEYYLLQEVDPQSPDSTVHWYLAEEINISQVSQPGFASGLPTYLWREMQEQKPPYPELQVFGRLYSFESQTQGNYESDTGEAPRITWDYWDQTRQWNLAIEAWPQERVVHAYSTKVVLPEEFADIEHGVQPSPSLLQNSAAAIPAWKLRVAWSVLIVGILMMLFG